MLKSINYAQRKVRPNHVSDKKDIDIQGTIFSKTIAGMQFLIHDSNDDDRVILFGSPDKVVYLANVSQIFMDGTFEVSSDVYYQLFTIQGMVGKTVIPLMYAFLVSKTKDIYIKLFYCR